MSELAKVYQEATTKRAAFESKLVLKAWENENFRKEFLANPKKVLEQETGQKVPDNLEVSTLEETGNKIYFVLPRNPVRSTADGVLTDEALSQVAAGALGILYHGGTATVSDDTGDLIYTPAKFLVWW